jgi:sigma-B regulation protein RsbU (phosphoserine phosphatase)
MQSFLKNLFLRIQKPAPNIDKLPYRFFAFVNYTYLLAGIFHFALIWVFAILGLNILSIYNIFSSAIWVICIYLNIENKVVSSRLLACLELLFHAYLCVIMIGWDSGFHYFILLIPSFIFLSIIPHKIKIILSIFTCSAYILLYKYTNQYPPIKVVLPGQLDKFNNLCIISTFASLAMFAYFYRRFFIKAENDLKIAHDNTAKALQKINENLIDAANYVKTILPKPISHGPIFTEWVFIPSESLGGDAFGYNWLDRENFSIYLLDVSGHGVSAALLSATIMNVMRSNALTDVDFYEPDQVLSALNKSFPSEKNSDMFFTIWYGVYNMNNRRLTFASGGHPPALLFTKSEDQLNSVVRIATKNNVVGGFEDMVFTKDSYFLDDYSSLYLFSDGVYEFLQADGSRWKYKEFENHISVIQSNNDDFKHIFNSIKKLNDTDIFEDDFTLLKVTFN